MAGYDFKLLGDIFREGIYEVPEYQRNYAWQEQQLKDLWEDLEGIVLENQSKHYTGTIIVEKLGDKSKFGKTFRQFKIIDGQQRLATLTILLFCLYEKMQKIGTEDATKTSENIFEYIKDKSTEEYKLKLNGSDDSFLKDFILKTPDLEMVGREAVTYSEERLKEAKDFFGKRLAGKDFGYPISLVEKITNRLLFIRYEVGSEVEAGLVFEVMNDRGKPLTQVDKIKNYLIYLSYKKEDNDLAKTINETWGEIFRNLMGIDKFDEDDLLRYHWIMYDGEYKTEALSDVHRRVKEKLNLKNSQVLGKIRDYISSLKETSYVFKELNNPETSFNDWQSRLEEIRKYINGLQRLKNIATFMPLLMASRIVFKNRPQNFREIVRLCEVFAFRVYKVGNRRTDTKYSKFCRLAHDLFEKRESNDNEKHETYDKILTEIKNSIQEYGEDDEFKNNLMRYDFYNGWLESYEIKYLLYELESQKCKSQKEAPPKWEEIEDSKRVSIEHIWSQTPRGYEEWTEEQKETHRKHVHKVGNLTLTFWNSELYNKDFPEKKGKYEESNLIIQRELSSYNSWGQDEIDKRAEEIVLFALERWKM